MKKKILGWSLYLLPFVVFAQTKYDIELPEGGREYEKSEWTVPLNFYITKKQAVFNEEGKQFVYLDDISNYCLSKYNVEEFLSPQLFVDKNIRFSFVQKVIKQLASVRETSVSYMTQLPQSRQGCLVLHISSLYKKDEEENRTLEQDIASEKDNEELNEEFSPPPPPLPMGGQEVTESTEEDADFLAPPSPPPLPSYLQLRVGLYSQNEEVVKEVLQGNKYAVVYLLPNKQIKYLGQIITDNEIANLQKRNQMLLLRFDKELLYGDYIHSMQRIYKKGKEIEDRGENAAYPIELFSDLEEFLQEHNIEL
ncbi:MAG: hypothetical protein Q4C98_09555 [Capnocytophaga sp.]|nr:hypothetical protein [Capnocytophaga sp.]